METGKARGRRNRLLLIAGSLTALGAIAALGVGATFGLFSATAPGQTDKFTAGKVTLTQTASSACTVSHMAPGDGTAGYPNPARTNPADATCTMTVKYTGTVPADLGLNVTLSGSGLYNSTATGLQLKVTDTGSTKYMTGTTLGGAATTGVTPSASNLLIAANVSPTASYTFTVNYALPESAGNAFQTKTTTVNLKVHAVQYANNGAKATVTACAKGKKCTAITAWS